MKVICQGGGGGGGAGGGGGGGLWTGPPMALCLLLNHAT